jgi:hypothetical protein
MAIYEWHVNDGNYYIGKQETGDLTWALVMLMGASFVCFSVLIIRRYFCKGELGYKQKDRQLLLEPYQKYDPHAGFIHADKHEDHKHKKKGKKHKKKKDKREGGETESESECDDD